MARSGAEKEPVIRSKSDARYWQREGRLKFHDSSNYSARMQVAGRREWFPLGTSNKRKAAAKAAEIYSAIQADGLEATVAKFKPKGGEEGGETTIGDLIGQAAGLSSARAESLEAYAKALRRIAAEIHGIELDRSTQEPAWKAWRARVEQVPLTSLSPVAIIGWKQARLKAAGTDPLAKGRAAVTINSLMRNAKSLFGRKILPFIEQSIVIPRPLPFDGVSLEKEPSLRYVSRVDAFSILARAREELALADPEAFKVLILALVCGLRRSEIDNLLWRSFDFPRKRVRIESTEYHELKSSDSAGEIDLNEETLALFRGLRAKAPTEIFVISNATLPGGGQVVERRRGKPSRDTKSRTYRCDAVFARVLAWLRAQGVEARKPLHTMRKEIGSIIAAEHGIFEASRYLRHSDIRITAAIYADKKKIVTPSTFEGLLGGSKEEETTTKFPLNAKPQAAPKSKSRRNGRAT